MNAITVTPSRIELREGQFYLPIDFKSVAGEQSFVVDIYSAAGNKHPDLHLGWWLWPIAATTLAEGIRLIYNPPDNVDVYLVSAEGELKAIEQWVNPNYRIAPLQLINLLWYDKEHSGRLQAQVTLVVTDEQLLQDYYADNQPQYALTTPFLHEFHQRRLEVLKRLFSQYITPESNVLDVGSGHSMFYLIGGERWKYRITCIDLDRALMKQIAPERLSYKFAVGSAHHLPFTDGMFNALYAGEVIEHVLDANATLMEWGRVLRPGGTIIVTTPNRKRLLNRINQTDAPVSFEHITEFTCNELTSMLESHGFEILKREGIYLELLSLWRQQVPYVDPLTAPQPWRRHLLALKPLMKLGRFVPQLAWDMIIVGRKQT